MGSPFKQKVPIDQRWKDLVWSKIDNHQHIDEVVGHRPSLQWAIGVLAKHSIPYKIFNLGAGVSRITTKTDKCPCCGKAL